MKQSEIDIENDEAIGRYIRKVTWTGLIINIILSGFKFFAGIIGSSQAVVADAVHSLSDATTDIAVIVGSYYWSKPPDLTHPYGHRRIETLVSIFIGSILLAAGIGIGWDAVISHPAEPITSPGWIAFYAAAISIVSKEILYRWTSSAGKRVKSVALASNAWHHRLDALSSIPVLLAVAGSILFPSLNFLDHLGAGIVSVFIIHASLKIIWEGIKEVIDAGAPKETYEKISNIVYQNKEVKQIHRVRTRYISTCLQVDLHIVVDSNMTVFEGHRIAEEVKAQILKEGPNIVDVIVHIEPLESSIDED